MDVFTVVEAGEVGFGDGFGVGFGVAVGVFFGAGLGVGVAASDFRKLATMTCVGDYGWGGG